MGNAAKWVKKHPVEAAAIAASAYFGGPAVMSALGAGGAGAAGAGSAAGIAGGTLGAEFGGMTAAQAAQAGLAGGGMVPGATAAGFPWEKAINLGGKGLMNAQSAGLLGAQEPEPQFQPPPPAQPVTTDSAAIAFPDAMPPQGGMELGGLLMMDPEERRKRLLAMRGGF